MAQVDDGCFGGGNVAGSVGGIREPLAIIGQGVDRTAVWLRGEQSARRAHEIPCW